MPLFRRCFCWRDVRTGSVASGVFTLTFAVIQILLQVAVWIGAASEPREGATNLFIRSNSKLTKEELEDLPYYITYIALAGMDLILVLVSVVQLVGVDRDYRGRTWLLPWIVFLPIYVLYETAINIYLMVYAFDGDRLNWPFVLPIIIALYWFIKLVLNISGFLCVISRYQELSKYGRTLTKRSSLANSFERDYPGAHYFNSMTGRGYDDDRSRGAPHSKFSRDPRHAPRKYQEAYEHSHGGHSRGDYVTGRPEYDYRTAVTNGYSYRY